MLIRRLRLENFRNIRELDLEFSSGRTILHGENAQGKTNILEALFVLAAAKSVRARHERELVDWTLEDKIPYVRIEADVERSDGPLSIDITVQLTPGEGGASATALHLQKRVRVNGTNRKVTGLVGEVQIILFEPQDVDLVSGPPTLRRRYLDLTLSQVDPQLFRSLQEYNRVLGQRNPLLKAIRENRSHVDELDYWDKGLVKAGAVVVNARRDALLRLDTLASEIHCALTADAEQLSLTYLPSLSGAVESEADKVEALFANALQNAREREIAQGTTIVGPHRDDFTFANNDVSLASFGSRGQQRLATLAIKLAEARLMEERTGEQPVLLLDDVLSELDPTRRSYLTNRIKQQDQAIVTTADISAFEPAFLDESRVLLVSAGTVKADRPSA